MKEGSFNSSSFERFFTSAASQCDAVVFTSQSLIENDMHLSARASTESLFGELMQRFSQVLFDDEITRDVVPTGQANCEPKQPRIYALGSAGASRTHPAVALADLLRQREITFGSFGKPVLRPLIVGLGLDERSAESVQTQITEHTNMLFLNARVAAKPDLYDENAEWLKFVTLWPFDPEYGPWPN